MIRIGTRGSALALWQAEHVRARLDALGCRSEIRKLTTTGDRRLDRPLEAVGGKAAFLKEIEEALLAGEIELAVHSLKDVPVELPKGLELCALLERADPRDALISASGASLDGLPPGSRVGTSSLRRRAQLLARRPDLAVVDLRGNVDTRLRRVGEGAFDAIVLAVAGIARLGREAEITERLDPDVMLPPPGQGVIAIERRTPIPGSNPGAELGLVQQLEHPPTAAAAAAERAFLASLGGGCNLPLGALAEADGGGFRLRALVASPDGTRVVRGERRGREPALLGRQLAEDLLARGAAALLTP